MKSPPLPINQLGPIGPPPAKPGNAKPGNASSAKAEDTSPRSTNSAGTTETAALSVGLGNLALDASGASNAEGGTDPISVAEMKMLVEMAGNRLMAGDVYMGMRYITLAQQVQPLAHPYAQQ